MLIIKAAVVSIIIWFILGFAVSLIGSTFFIPSKLKMLAERGKSVEGKVVSKELEDDFRIDYAYSVDGNPYAGSGYGGNDLLSFNELSVGTTVRIYYDPTDPTVSSLGSPEYHIKSTEVLIRALSIGIPFWPVLIFFVVSILIAKSRRASHIA